MIYNFLDDYLKTDKPINKDILVYLNNYVLDDNIMKMALNTIHYTEPLIKTIERISKEPMLKEPMLKEPMLKEPMLKEHMLKEPMLKEPMLKEPMLKKSDILFPKEKDSLFWCFYIMKYGEFDYEILEHKNIIIEKKIKIEYVEKIRKLKHIIKTFKLASLTNTENNLANEQYICLTSFLSLCVVENLNTIFIKNNTFYELRLNDTTCVNIIYKIHNRYGICISNNTQKIDEIKNKLFKIDNIDKPIKSLSFYKLQDLLDICKKMSIETINIETNKTKNKTELYTSITKHFN